MQEFIYKVDNLIKGKDKLEDTDGKVYTSALLLIEFTSL